MKEFFVGLHHPADAQHVQPSFISINALRNRRSGFPAGRWVLDSGAFTAIQKHGKHVLTAHAYAAQVCYWKQFGEMAAFVCRDMMC